MDPSVFISHLTGTAHLYMYFIGLTGNALGSYPFPKRQIVKEFADDNFKFDENSRNFSKRVENTAGKGEIARYEQFLLFPVFLKDLDLRHVKTGLVLERVKIAGQRRLYCSLKFVPSTKNSNRDLQFKNSCSFQIPGRQHLDAVIHWKFIENRLTLSQMTKFRLFRSQRVCRLQFQIR